MEENEMKKKEPNYVECPPPNMEAINKALKEAEANRERKMNQRPIGLKELNKMADYRSDSVVITTDLLEPVDEVEAYFQFVQYEEPQVLPISFSAVRQLINEREVRGAVRHIRGIHGRRTGFLLILEFKVDMTNGDEVMPNM